MNCKFKVGDKIKGISKTRYFWTDTRMIEGEITHINSNGEIDVKILKHEDEWIVGKVFTGLSPEYFELVDAKLNGLELIQQITEGKVKDKKIEVYKNDKYITTLTVKENILDNPQFHVGMLTSNKYTFKPKEILYLTYEDIAKKFDTKVELIRIEG